VGRAAVDSKAALDTKASFMDNTKDLDYFSRTVEEVSYSMGLDMAMVRISLDNMDEVEVDTFHYSFCIIRA
jgi:hypothetical protein